MSNHFMFIFRLAILVLLISTCKAQPGHDKLISGKDDNSLLWEVSGNGLAEPSYIFGSFHLLCRDDIHFSDQLLKALKYSREVYFELDLDDPSVLVAGILLLNMKDGKKLKDLYNPAEYAKIVNFFRDSLRTSMLLFENMKPAFLESMLYPKMMPCKNISGVEEELMVVAKKEKKKIQGLETMAFQASVFDSIPYAEQAKELLRTIDSLNSYRKYFDTMTRVYKSQQLGEIEKMFNRSEFGLEENEDLLLYNRNKNWVAQLKGIMKKQPVFVAVGAGHLVGYKGLISLLKREGYSVRSLRNE